MTDNAFTEEQQAILSIVLDMIVPASDDGRMPSAADVDVPGYILEDAPDLVPALCDELARLDRDATERFDRLFAELAGEDRQALVDDIRSEDPGFLAALAANAVTRYYQDDRVLRGLGMEARPPFPLGYTVVRGDLSLLDPVRARGRIWRDAPD